VESLEIITQLENLLVEERAAIARLDGATVDVLAREKKALAEALERRSRAERSRHAVPMGRLVRNLKANGVLLAQAFAILSEFLVGPGASLRIGPSSTFPSRASRPPRHISVRG
jgi:hypothetical protein